MRFALEGRRRCRAAVRPSTGPVPLQRDYVEAACELPEAIVMARCSRRPVWTRCAARGAIRAKTEAVIAPGCIPVVRYAENAAAHQALSQDPGARRSAATTISICLRLCCATEGRPSSSWRAPRSLILSCAEQGQGRHWWREVWSTALVANCTRRDCRWRNRVNPHRQPPHLPRDEHEICPFAEPKKKRLAGAGVAAWLGGGAAPSARWLGQTGFFEASDEIESASGQR